MMLNLGNEIFYQYVRGLCGQQAEVFFFHF